jgi:ABC-2 type transport system ATP-binding protein
MNGGACKEAQVDSILEVRSLGKTYGAFTLGDVSFSLPRGYIMGLIGPNGAGKTTIIRLILGLARPDRGQICAFGLDAGTDGAAIRSRVGFVHEAPSFYLHLTPAGLASLVAPFYPHWDAALFRRLASEFELPLGKRVYALSRGMRTKLALALALSHGAELLVLDEPTSGLDPVFRRELLERLSACIQDGNRSVLFSTQITSDLERVADYITFIRDGQLVFSATRDEVKERWGLVKGGLDLLDEDGRRFFRGIETSAFSFTAITDDVQAARQRFSGREVIIEQASLEDVMFYLSRARVGMDASTSTAGPGPSIARNRRGNA